MGITPLTFLFEGASLMYPGAAAVLFKEAMRQPTSRESAMATMAASAAGLKAVNAGTPDFFGAVDQFGSVTSDEEKRRVGEWLSLVMGGIHRRDWVTGMWRIGAHRLVGKTFADLETMLAEVRGNISRSNGETRPASLMSAECVDMMVGEHLEPAMAFDFSFKGDLIAEVKKVAAEIAAIMEESPIPNVRLKVEGDSARADKPREVAAVLLSTLSELLSIKPAHLELELQLGHHQSDFFTACKTRKGELEMVDESEAAPLEVETPLFTETEPLAMRPENIDGWPCVHCVPPAAVLSQGLSPRLLESVFREVFRVYPDVQQVFVDFSSLGLKDENLLSATWGMVKPLPIAIFPSGREVGLHLLFDAKTEIKYGLFRGAKDLRKSLYDIRGEHWEALEQGRHDLLVREFSKDPLVVEIHADPNVVREARKPLPEIVSGAVRVVAQRKNLKEIILVVEADHRNEQDFLRLAQIFVGIIFAEILDYSGRLTLAIVRGNAVWKFSFERNRQRKVIAVGTGEDTLRTFPHPPHLYPEVIP